MKTRILSLCVLFIAFLGMSQAQTKFNQRHRIQEGWRSGELTPREMRYLGMEQKRFHHEKRRMLRDGKLDRCEKRKLHRMKKHSNRDIWREKHDGERRRNW